MAKQWYSFSLVLKHAYINKQGCVKAQGMTWSDHLPDLPLISSGSKSQKNWFMLLTIIISSSLLRQIQLSATLFVNKLFCTIMWGTVSVWLCVVTNMSTGSLAQSVTFLLAQALKYQLTCHMGACNLDKLANIISALLGYWWYIDQGVV